MSTLRNFSICLAPQFSLTQIDGKLVLFSKQTGDFFGLNESALVLLQKLLANDFDTALNLAAQEFEVEKDILQKDFLELVSELEKLNILKRVYL